MLAHDNHAQLAATEQTEGGSGPGWTPAAHYFQRARPRNIRLLQLLLLPGLELPAVVFDRMCNNANESADRKGRSPPAKLALQPKSACEVLTTAELRLLQQAAVRLLPAHITALCASPQLDCGLLQMLLSDSKAQLSLRLALR